MFICWGHNITFTICSYFTKLRLTFEVNKREKYDFEIVKSLLFGEKSLNTNVQMFGSKGKCLIHRLLWALQ